MNRKEKDEIIFAALNNVYSKLTTEGYNLIYLAAYGSMNYNLDEFDKTYKSDIDMKAFVYPTISDLYHNSYINKSVITDFGIVEIKDIRLLVELVGKMNSSCLELLETKYCIFKGETEKKLFEELKDPYEKIKEERFPLLILGLYGTINNKRARILKNISEKAEKYAQTGFYDPKDIQHSLRMQIMVHRLVDQHMSLKDALYFNDGKERDKLMEYKINPTIMSKEEIEKLFEDIDDDLKPIVEIEKTKCNGSPSIIDFDKVIYKFVVDEIFKNRKEI